MFDESRSILPAMIEAMLPRFSGKLGLRFRLRMNLDYYGDRKDISKEQYEKLHDCYCVEYVVVRPYNYTKVFSRHGTFGSFSPNPRDNQTPTPWMFVADHDSCWREALDLPMHLYFDRRQPFLDAGLVYHEISERASFDLNGDPQYIILESAEPVKPIERGDYATRFSTPHNLSFKRIPIHQIFEHLAEYQRAHQKETDHQSELG